MLSDSLNAELGDPCGTASNKPFGAEDDREQALTLPNSWIMSRKRSSQQSTKSIHVLSEVHTETAAATRWQRFGASWKRKEMAQKFSKSAPYITFQSNIAFPINWKFDPKTCSTKPSLNLGVAWNWVLLCPPTSKQWRVQDGGRVSTFWESSLSLGTEKSATWGAI